MEDKIRIAFNNRFIRMAFLLLPYLYAVSVFIRMSNSAFWKDDYDWISNAMRATRDVSFLLTPVEDFFRPIVNVVFVVNFWLSGLDPSGYYLANIVLHLINVFLVFQLVYRLSGESQIIAWFASLLFAGAVGNYGRAVIWICGRTGLIVTAFYLCTMICYWSFLHNQRWYNYVLTILFFTMALLSKESTVTLLPTLILLDWIGTRKPFRTMLTLSRLKWYIPFGLLLIPYLWYEVGLQQSHYVVLENHYQIGWHFFSNVQEYLTLMVLPVRPQSTFVQVPSAIAFTFSVGRQIFEWSLLVGWLLLLGTSTHASLRFSILWMILSILPYAFFTHDPPTRYLYTPSIGFVMAATFLASIFANRLKAGERKRKWMWLTVGVVIVILGIQWTVVNHDINQWNVLRLQQDEIAYKKLVELARALGY